MTWRKDVDIVDISRCHQRCKTRSHPCSLVKLTARLYFNVESPRTLLSTHAVNILYNSTSSASCPSSRFISVLASFFSSVNLLQYTLAIIPVMRLYSAMLVLLASLILAAPQSSQDSSVPAEYASDSDFQETILNVTNLYRQQHNASQLTWNESLAEYAKDWSEDCKFEHSGGPSGENLASGYPNVTASVEAWGNDYDFKKGQFS